MVLAEFGVIPVDDKPSLVIAEQVETLLDLLAEPDILDHEHGADVVHEPPLEIGGLPGREVEVPSLAGSLGAGRQDLEHRQMRAARVHEGDRGRPDVAEKGFLLFDIHRIEAIGRVVEISGGDPVAEGDAVIGPGGLAVIVDEFHQ